jgi:hypothetical protein
MSLEEAFTYYRDIIQMQYLAPTTIAPGETDMSSSSQEQKPEPSVTDKKLTGENRPSLTPEQVRAGSNGNNDPCRATDLLEKVSSWV